MCYWPGFNHNPGPFFLFLVRKNNKGRCLVKRRTFLKLAAMAVTVPLWSRLAIAKAQSGYKNPILYGMELSAKGAPIRFQMKPDGDVAFKGFDTTLQPIAYQDFQSYDDLVNAFEPGGGTALFGNDTVGNNVVMATHSGYHGGQPLMPGEPLRTFMEGGYTKDKKTMILYDGDTRQRKIKELLGRTMVITQGDMKVTVKINSIAYVPHQDVKEFSNDLQSILQVVLDSQADPTVKAAFQQAVTDPQQHLLLFFCGWGSNLSYPNWATWSRYVFDFMITPPEQ